MDEDFAKLWNTIEGGAFTMQVDLCLCAICFFLPFSLKLANELIKNTPLQVGDPPRAGGFEEGSKDEVCIFGCFHLLK
jgi:hypothetical protein